MERYLYHNDIAVKELQTIMGKLFSIYYNATAIYNF